MEGLVESKENEKIADGLGISSDMVEIHRAQVMEKMRADGLAALVRMVIAGRAPHG
jgi:two-component system, LuxR family, response regulator FixJ